MEISSTQLALGLGKDFTFFGALSSLPLWVHGICHRLPGVHGFKKQSANSLHFMRVTLERVHCCAWP